MVIEILPIRPNPRETYQNQVIDLCKLLKDEAGKSFRVSVFRLLTKTARDFARSGRSHFHEIGDAKIFLRDHPLDIRALKIMDELDKLYSAPIDQIDNLRGAVGEVFSLFICRKIYSKTNIEVKVKINMWLSNSIDVAGCSEEKGHCIQSKCTMSGIESIKKQKGELDKIEELTAGRAKGVFITFVDRGAFLQSLKIRGIDSSSYKILDRADLFVLEDRLS